MPNRLNFTKAALTALPPAEKGRRAYYSDTQFKGLQIAVTDKGTKTYVLYRKVNGKPTRMKLGYFPDLPPASARDKAHTLRAQLAKGIDPKAEKRLKKAQAVTLADAFEAFKAARNNLKPRTLNDYERYITVALSDWQSKRLVEITKDMVAQRHSKLGKDSGPGYANNAMTCLRTIWNFAASYYETDDGKRVLPDNPVKRLRETRSWFKLKPRRTWIKPHELPEWFKAVDSLRTEPMNSPMRMVGDYLFVLILTGLRKEEGLSLTWQQIDLQDRTLNIPNPKNAESHTLPLSSVLYDLLKSRHDEALNEYVFPGKDASGHLIEPRNHIRKVVEVSNVVFTPHDLRRTFVTYAERLDIPAYALKRLLNHKMRNDITSDYIGIDVERLRDPMQKITNHFMQLGYPELNQKSPHQ